MPMKQRLRTERSDWWFSEAAVPESRVAGLQAQQMASMARITSIILLSNIINIVAVVGLFIQAAPMELLLVWAGVGLAVNWAALNKHISFQKSPPEKRNNRRAIRDYVHCSVMNGVLWGTGPVIAHIGGDPHGHMLMGIIVAGMMFAGGFLLSRIPKAAYSFIVPTGLGMAVALQFQPGSNYMMISILTIFYLMLLVVAVKWTHRQFVEQYLGEAAIQEQHQLIGLLLRDFEESASDWLWQTDSHGVLQPLPLAFEGDSQISAVSGGRMPAGEQFLSMFESGDAKDALEDALAAHAAFRDLAVRTTDENGAGCWWSVTGKPVFENGLFQGFRGVAADITESKEIEDRIARMAHFDSLTGLANRMTAQDKVREAFEQRVNPAACKALLLMDLDNFKWVNDTLGHPAGDELLRQVSGRLKALCQPDDFMARLGGDEFALIVERPSEDALETFLDHLATEMSRPYNIWGSSATCSASIGVRIFEASVPEPRVMMTHADLALYQAKHLGKAKWCMFSAELEERARVRQEIREEFQRALEEGELRVYFQPVVHASSHKVVACEALVRWEHPQRGIVYPGEFIEHAEENGLITRMGEWVIRAALAEAARMPEHLRLSINISPLQIHSVTLVTTIINAIAASGVDPARLELEITETALMSNTGATLRRLHQLRDLGISIALDDFGTGYSSLSLLRAFPFDRIKIDRQFVSDMESRTDSQAITMATVNLAKSLGMRCTAEGVETLYQAEFLRDMGCEELQGFFISRALPLDQLTHLIEVTPFMEAPVVRSEPLSSWPAGPRLVQDTVRSKTG
ncbi:putative bifunctional diguanylate cyclase/phosphodiesterase [Hyphomonas sp.]|uniref:putative bifunctional diguanylate cyclase/phosphodiesterase n=1 Tax=Hyphomonas sp. TaxID=87 RepID=UPI00391CB558